MKCKNCKADNKQESICDAGITCYVLRCGEYGCALNGKTVDKLLRMKKAATNADRIRSMTDEELDKFLGEVQWDVANYCGGVTQKQEYPVPEQRGAWLDWLRQEAEDGE